MHKVFNGHFEDKIFTDDFEPLSFFNDGDQLKAIDLSIHKKAGAYLLSAMTYDIYSERKSEEGDETDNVYVVAATEILPSDLIAIRDSSYEQLYPYLVPQVET